jgi:cytoskeletal protein CcmA (bactofilin family)
MSMFNHKDSKKEMEQVSTNSTHIAKGTVIEGNIEAHGNIRIDGKVIGNIKCKSKVAMGESSKVEGNILSQNAEIAGEIKGMIEISELLVLKPTGIVNGDIVANKMVVEVGGAFNGQCKMATVVKEIQIGEPEKFKPAKEKTA